MQSICYSETNESTEGDHIKTLIIVSHPDIENSQTEQFLKKGAEFTDTIWHHVEDLKEINVDMERQLLASCDRILLQFPLYWYSSPAGLKHWLDTVMSQNYVYGDGQYHLANKELGLVVTTGLPEKDFQVGAAEDITLDEILAPFRAFAHRAHMKILPKFLVDQFWYKTENQQMQLLIDYQRYLTQSYPDTLTSRSKWFEERLQKFVNKMDNSDKTSGELILDTYQQQMENLDQVNDTLKMIKKGEDDKLE